MGILSCEVICTWPKKRQLWAYCWDMTLKLMHETLEVEHLDSSNKLSKKDVQIGTDIVIMFRKASNNVEETYVKTSGKIIICKTDLQMPVEKTLNLQWPSNDWDKNFNETSKKPIRILLYFFIQPCTLKYKEYLFVINSRRILVLTRCTEQHWAAKCGLRFTRACWRVSCDTLFWDFQADAINENIAYKSIS